MSLKEKYESLKCNNEYNEFLLNCIKEYFAENNPYKDWKIKCDGSGKCFTNIPGTYIFHKFMNCKCNCELLKCPNFILCQNFVPKIILDEYDGLCYHCSIAYKPSKKNKGKLEVFNNKKCEKCNCNAQCIEQPFCEHILCLECFRLAHFKPGNDECPICEISRYKVSNF